MLNGLLRDCVKAGYSMEFSRKYLFAFGYNFKPSDIKRMIDHTRNFKGLHSGVDLSNHDYKAVRDSYNDYMVAKEVLAQVLKDKHIPYCHW